MKSHQYIEPWTPAYLTTDVEQIDAEQNELSRQRERARAQEAAGDTRERKV